MKKLVLILGMILICGIGNAFEVGDIVQRTGADTKYEIIRGYPYHPRVFRVKEIKSGKETYMSDNSFDFSPHETILKLRQEIAELKQVRKEDSFSKILEKNKDIFEQVLSEYRKEKYKKSAEESAKKTDEKYAEEIQQMINGKMGIFNMQITQSEIIKHLLKRIKLLEESLAGFIKIK